ncbi:Piso0_002978 [Millerozyma farinosa CBS 7064]|uniref:Piso0_002978 protein n=1 Tax=Pichia sorbitophila (strain ATCC MYA-4447 / BCRC 22081 / CBS 7064 / NBRC 10061 / NRRL Y-12695) TaxID=559304 RepID=G8YK06_PICSO|nr:Piso0_002978 [Millerozyma farinosa CBS 7064]CCE80651.1 Piso0_002978 [Millerozyma farinosa CBS 7064]
MLTRRFPGTHVTNISRHIFPLRLMHQTPNYIPIQEWNESEIIVDRKSKFQARSVYLASPEHIGSILKQLLQENKKIAKSASHPHMIAWRTGTVVETTSDNTSSKKNKKGKALKEKRIVGLQQGFDDNGESGAGSRMLHNILVQHNLCNILLIATRWYGGVQIGPSRFRNIMHVCNDSLRKWQQF